MNALPFGTTLTGLGRPSMAGPHGSQPDAWVFADPELQFWFFGRKIRFFAPRMELAVGTMVVYIGSRWCLPTSGAALNNHPAGRCIFRRCKIGEAEVPLVDPKIGLHKYESATILK